MWSMHIQSEFVGSFEESYHLHPNIKIWNVPKNNFWYFKWICLWVLYMKPEHSQRQVLEIQVSNAKYALIDPFLWELWRIISIATLHTQCFGHSKYFVCEFCCKTFQLVGSLKNHDYWLHASEIWLYAKASFGTSTVSNAIWSQEAHFSQPG